MRFRIGCAFGLLLTLFVVIPAAVQAREVRDFPLAGLTPDQAVEVVKPLLSAEGKVVAVPEQNKIIVVDSIEKIDEVERILKQVDHRRRQVSAVFQVKQIRRKNLAAAGLREAAAGNGWYMVRGAFTAEKQEGATTGRFQIRTLEGSPARLETGTIRPVSESVITWLGGHGLYVYQHSFFQQITSGFIVLPQLLSGNRLRLQITPWLRGFDRNRQERVVDITEAATTVELNSGETIILSGVEGSASSVGSTFLTAVTDSRDNALVLEITAETE